MRPSHGSQVQISEDIRVEIVSVAVKMASSAGNVSTEKVHVVLVHAATMIGDASRDVSCVACCLHLTPTIVALKGTTAGRGEFFRIDLLKALQVEFVEGIETSLTDVKTAEDKQFLVEDETRVVAATVWLLAEETKFDPVAHEFGGTCHAGGHLTSAWADRILVPQRIHRRISARILHFFHSV